MLTLIRFGKFEEITVLMEKHVILTQTSDFNSVDLKKAKKIIKGQIFFQRPNLKAKGQKFQILLFFQ